MLSSADHVAGTRWFMRMALILGSIASQPAYPATESPTSGWHARFADPSLWGVAVFVVVCLCIGWKLSRDRLREQRELENIAAARFEAEALAETYRMDAPALKAVFPTS